MLPNVSEIKIRRKALRISQKELAEMAGISRPSLNKLENGESDLSYSKVKSLFDVLENFEKGAGAWLLHTGRLGDIHSQSVEYVSVGDSVRSICWRMIETNFSQFPVREGDRIVGSISEVGINRAIAERGRDAAEAKVGEMLENPFPVFGVDAKVQSVIGVLRSVPAILTTDKGAITGIVTNQDFYKKLI